MLSRVGLTAATSSLVGAFPTPAPAADKQPPAPPTLSVQKRLAALATAINVGPANGGIPLQCVTHRIGSA
jgi:hypothetical protein